MTKSEQKQINALIDSIQKKLANIEAGQRFLAFVAYKKAKEEYLRTKAIYEHTCTVRRTVRRRKARR